VIEVLQDIMLERSLLFKNPKNGDRCFIKLLKNTLYINEKLHVITDGEELGRYSSLESLRFYFMSKELKLKKSVTPMRLSSLI
jgi:hypothetical protein